MTRAQLIEQLRQQQTTLLTGRRSHEEAITTLFVSIGTGTPTTAQDDQLRAAASAIKNIDAEVAGLAERESQLADQEVADQKAAALRGQLAGNTGTGDGGTGGTGTGGGAVPGQRGADGTYSPARVTKEERTYSQHRNLAGEVSFFGDSYRYKHVDDMNARDRLERHAREVVLEGEMSKRALATGGLSGLVVPQYLVDLAAPVIRAGRPMANAVKQLALPEQGMSLIIPRGTTGAAVASQAAENTSVQNTDEAWTTLTVPVVTIAGQQDLSRQLLERGTPGIDEIIYNDLAGAYHAELDRQIIAGSGASGQMLGILNSNPVTATAFGAAPTPGAFYSKTAGAIAAVAGVGAGIQPQLVLQHPRRWGWLNAQVDTTGRPFVVPGAQGPYNTLGINEKPGQYGGDGHVDPNAADGYTVVGSIQGLPVITDANVPTTFGTTAAEDIELIFDPKHALLWEDNARMPKQLKFEQTLGNQLTVKIVVYNYAAFTSGRYPQAFARVGGADATAGQGLVTPTF